MSVDVRTRLDSETHIVEATDLFEHDLPAAFDSAAPRLERSMGARPPRPLTVDVGGRRWTLEAIGGRAVVRPGHRAEAPVLRLDADQLTDLVADLVTPMGWLATGTLHIDGGGLTPVLDWWLVLRAVLDGTTPHTEGAVSFTRLDGSGLDLRRSFVPDDPAEEMAWFLEQAGYLHIRGLYGDGEMAAVSGDMDDAAPRYSEGDGRSWWASLESGARVLVRMQGFDTESGAVADLVADDRLARLGALTGDGHVVGSGVQALFKPLGVVQGISDVPWHKDCSLGRHSYDCCSVTVGISVTGADARSGQLRVVAGSHRALVWPAPTLQPGLDLPVVDLATETGDVTVHLSCTLHMAQPPVDRQRRVLYTRFALPVIDARAHAGRERLRAMREAAPVNTSQSPSYR